MTVYIKFSLRNGIIPCNNKSGHGYTAFQLFKRCKLGKYEYDKWYIKIDAHDDALPLMFDFKEKYVTYTLANALSVKSANQLHMYEILKQYKKIGRLEIVVDDLRELLGIKKDEYTRRDNFKVKVLDACRRFA